MSVPLGCCSYSNRVWARNCPFSPLCLWICICEYIFLLKFFFNPQIDTHGVLQLLRDGDRTVILVTLSVEVERDDTVFCGALALAQDPVCSLLSLWISCLVLSWGVCYLKSIPKHNAEVLVPPTGRLHHTYQQIPMWEALRALLRWSVTDCEVNANESHVK